MTDPPPSPKTLNFRFGLDVEKVTQLPPNFKFSNLFLTWKAD